jgi:hypothetical protein
MPTSRADALPVFTLRVKHVRVRVKLLANVDAVDAAWDGDRSTFTRGVRVHAMFVPDAPSSGFDGTIILPRRGLTVDLVVHETVHAVLYADRVLAKVLGESPKVVYTGEAEELFANTVGLLAHRILRKLRALGVRVG